MDNNFLKILSKIDINNFDYKNEELVKSTFIQLFNIIEKVVAENEQLKQTVQELKNEINTLKGEKGKPDIKPNTQKKNNVTKLEKPKKKRKKRRKNETIKIDREEIVKIEQNILPPDAEFKGYQTKTIQNLIIKTDNVLYKMECYYSKSEGKSYTASLPDYLTNTSFGPELKAFIYMLYYECRVSEPLIATMLNSHNIQISEGSISNILIYDKAKEFSQEKIDIFNTATELMEYHQIDDTGIRVNGVNHYATILCNELYSAFFIRRYKNRETVIRILSGVEEDSSLDIASLKTIIKILIADDAPQFKKIVEYLGLCWIHESRHYEKMVPVIPHHKELLTKVISQIWDYYKELKNYKEDPNELDKAPLGLKFDKIFTQTTGYADLDARLQLTYNKKPALLLVLDYPQIPLHNNVSEAAARTIVTKRKISGGIRNIVGKTAWENALSIYSTCKKHSIDFYSYVLDIFKGSSHRQTLSSLILEKVSSKNDELKCFNKPA